MTERSDQPTPTLDPLSRGALVRAAADGELSAEQSRALETLRSSDASIEREIVFERALRDRVATTMREPSVAPASLRASIEALIAQERGTVGPHATRTRSFWAKRAGWLVAAAAVLVVASITYIAGWPSQQPPRPTSTIAAAPFEQGRLIAASNFIAREHNRCAPFERYFNLKMSVRDAAEANDMVVTLLGAPPTRIKLDDAGYTFAGMGRCAVPGPGDSVHMIYRPVGDAPGVVSLFIQKLVNEPAMADDVRYHVPIDGGGSLLIWRDSGLIYYLFCQDEATGSDISGLLNAPARELPA